MADPVRVFVSHHHSPEENVFTTRLVEDLHTAGADIWVDDRGITSGDFVRKINEGLADDSFPNDKRKVDELSALGRDNFYDAIFR